MFNDLNWSRQHAMKMVVLLGCGISTIFFASFATAEETVPVTNRIAPRVQVEVALLKAPPPDILDDASALAKLPAGTLAYITLGAVPGQKAWQFFLIVRKSGVAQDRPGSVSSYHLIPQEAEIVHSPKLSSDGRYVLFQVGWPYDSPGYYTLHLLDLKTNQLQHARLGSLTSSSILWSPDSKHFASIAGDDGSGGGVLFIYDIRNSNKRYIAQDRGVARMAWTQQNTLLFTVERALRSVVPLAEAEKKDTPQTNKANAEEIAEEFPAGIYEVEADKGNPALLIKGGVMPSPSPDGKWVAFFGLPEPSPEEKAKAPAKPDRYDFLNQPVPRLCVYNRAEKKIYPLEPETPDLSSHHYSVRWTPDSRQIILVDQRSLPQERGEAAIYLSDVEDRIFKKVATLQAKDKVSFSWSRNNPQFEVLETSPDGIQLFVITTEMTEIKRNRILGVRTLRSINLMDGTISVVVRLVAEGTEEDKGSDWILEGNTPVKLD